MSETLPEKTVIMNFENEEKYKDNKKHYKPINPKRRKRELEKLRNLFERPDMVLVIHYSCESFYEKKDKSCRITSIAIRNLETAQTCSFSIHNQAEIENVIINEETLNKLERKMLDNYFSYIKNKKDKKLLSKK